jgi:hypothetical protein
MNSEAGPSTGRIDEGPFGPLHYDESGIEKGSGGKAGSAEVQIRRGELAVLKGAGAAVIYEMAVRCFLELGRPAVLVDGGCQADPYEVAAIAKRLDRERREEAGGGNGCGGGNGGGNGNGGGGGKGAPVRARRVDEDEVLRNIHVARAFTAHQLEALIVSRLEPLLERVRPAFVGVMSIDVLFFDEELDRYEARIMQVRCTRTLRRLAREHDVMAAATESGTVRTGRARWW